MERKTLVGRLELKFATDGDTQEKSLVGYGAHFNNVDSYGDIIVPGAFAKTIEKHKAAGTMPAMLWNHDAYAMPIGRWDYLVEDENGLKASGAFVPTQAGNDAYLVVKAQAVTGLSIGYVVTGFELDGKTRRITEVELFEISVVTFPANDLARIEDVKNMRMNAEIKAKAEEALRLAQEALEKVKSLFDDDDDCDCDPDEDGDCDCDDEELSKEAKYDEASIMAAIKSIVATTKEINVR